MASTHNATIAIVDDDRGIRESIASLVESSGHVARTFVSVEDFMQENCLAETRCLITDIRMPGADGLELQRRARLARPDLAIIVITALEDDEAQQKALDQGAAFFFRKPFDPAVLLEAVDHVLSQFPADN
jgi:FixJ family two-component response regulator